MQASHPLPGGQSRRSSLPPAVIVRGAGDARTVLALGRPVLLLSPPEAVRLLGPAWWVAMIAASREAGSSALDALDCGALAGAAQEALALGAGGIVFSGDARQAVALASIAASRGALFLRSAPRALDMGAYGAERRLPSWLATR